MRPSIRSRSMSAWPQWRAYSSIMWTSTERRTCRAGRVALRWRWKRSLMSGHRRLRGGGGSSRSSRASRRLRSSAGPCAVDRARPARPRCVALEARGCECSEQAGSGLDAVASVDIPAVAHLLRDGELELLVDAELGADVVEAFNELLTLGTLQNPSVKGAAHRGAAARELHPSVIVDVSAGEHRRVPGQPGVCACLAGKSSEVRVAVAPVHLGLVEHADEVAHVPVDTGVDAGCALAHRVIPH